MHSSTVPLVLHNKVQKGTYRWVLDSSHTQFYSLCTPSPLHNIYNPQSVWTIVKLFFFFSTSSFQRNTAAPRLYCEVISYLTKSLFWHNFFLNKNPEQSLPLLLLFPWPQVPGSGSSTGLDPPCLQILCRRKKKIKNLGSESNNSRCSISASRRYASFQVLLSPCEIDSQCVENLRPCWHCCADTCCGLRCPWTPEVLPPPLLLTEPISTPCSFVSRLFALQNTYLKHSVQAWLCGFHNEMPGKFLHVFGELFLLLLGTFWRVCAARVRPTKVVFFFQSPTFVVVRFCIFYAPQTVKSYTGRLYALVAFFHVQGVRLSYSFYQLLLL